MPTTYQTKLKMSLDTLVNKRLEEYLLTFKQDIKDMVITLDFDSKGKTKISTLLEYVYEYPRLSFTSEELQKPKRTKLEMVGTDMEHRCMAKLSSGERCTRKKKLVSSYCGTHKKTHTEENIEKICPNERPPDTCTLEVFTEDFQGIVYYIDLAGNVYNTEDVLMKIKNPRIIAHAQRGTGPGNILFTWLDQDSVPTP